MSTRNFLSYILATIAIAGLIWFAYNDWSQKQTSGQSSYHAGNRYFEDGNYAEATESYKSAIANDPADLDAKRGLARSYMQLEKYNQALRLFDHVIAQAPEFAPSYANRGILHDRMQHYSLAIQDYQQALRRDPELAKGPGWLTRFLRNQAERPPGILDRLKYLQSELQKPEDQRVLTLPEKDQQQRPYKIDAH